MLTYYEQTDSIAGQMNAMRGAPPKKKKKPESDSDDDEDESDTDGEKNVPEESETDTDTDTDEEQELNNRWCLYLIVAVAYEITQVFVKSCVLS